MREFVDPSRSDRRRDWGLILLAGGGIAMTVYAAVSLWMLFKRGAPIEYLFWSNMAALGLVGIVLTGFTGLLIKRTFRISRDGLEYTDTGDAK